MNMSPYQFSKVLTKELSRNIPPQMIYNYISKGKIKAETNELGKKFVTTEEQVRVLEMLTKPQVEV